MHRGSSCCMPRNSPSRRRAGIVDRGNVCWRRRSATSRLPGSVADCGSPRCAAPCGTSIDVASLRTSCCPLNSVRLTDQQLDFLDFSCPHWSRLLAPVTRFGHRVACSSSGFTLAIRKRLPAARLEVDLLPLLPDPPPERLDTFACSNCLRAVPSGIPLCHALGVVIERGGQVRVALIETPLRP